MLHHFYLTLPSGEVRSLSAPFLPRVGDTIAIDHMDVRIDKVVWMSNGTTLADEPLMDGKIIDLIHVDHAVTSDLDQLARDIADRNADRLIPAIKEYRAVTGLGLKESKEVMDKTFRELGYR